jgi:hypothetical protein
LPLSIAEALRNSGHDALATKEANMLGAADDVLLAFAAGSGEYFSALITPTFQEYLYNGITKEGISLALCW